MWGGTNYLCILWAIGNISIHPPRVGRDRIDQMETARQAEFQSTLPVWGGTLNVSAVRKSLGFQSTLPVWGGTIPYDSIRDAYNISIHPPRVGRDPPISSSVP